MAAGLVAALLSAPPTAAARARGELVLDAADPVVVVDLAGQRLRLRVDLAQWESIELNPEAAARLSLAWMAGRDLAVGRVMLPGRIAEAKLIVEGVRMSALVVQHGRAAATGADGVIGPDLLPYTTVRWRRVEAPAETGTLVLPLALDRRRGLTSAAEGVAPSLSLRFSLAGAVSDGTAAAGAILARHYGGRFAGPAERIPIILGVTRPVRPIAFARPPSIAGFRFALLPVRINDFRGDNALPAESPPDADIIVSKPESPQGAEPWILIGGDRLSRCAEIAYQGRPRTLTLHCAFDR